MGKNENRIIDWIITHLWLIFVVAVTICSIIIRFCFRKYESLDYSIYLSQWWNEIHDNGGIFALKKQVGNYNMLYQFFIAIMTYIPIKPLYQYKIFSIVFDYFLAGLVGYITYDISKKDITKGVLAYAVVIMSPVVFLNSSAWGQCDSIYTFFVVLSLFLMIKERYASAFIILGVAFAFKLQAVFVLPFYVFYYFQKKKFSIGHFFMIPLTMCVTSIPNLIMGRNVFELFSNYTEQMQMDEKLSMNYPSFWCVFNNASNVDSLKEPAIILTIVILGTYIFG